jgi:hypothetical protein
LRDHEKTADRGSKLLQDQKIVLVSTKVSVGNLSYFKSAPQGTELDVKHTEPSQIQCPTKQVSKLSIAVLCPRRTMHVRDSF